MLSRGVGTRPQQCERQKPWAPLVKQPTVAGSNRARSASRKCCLAVRAIVHFFQRRTGIEHVRGWPVGVAEQIDCGGLSAKPKAGVSKAAILDGGVSPPS